MLEEASELPNWLLIWRISVPRHQRNRTRRRNRRGTIQVFGVKWHESFVRYDPDSCSWSTHRCLWGRGTAVVIGDLAGLGYDARWCRLSASDVGAPHLRDRFCLVANADPTSSTSGTAHESAEKPENPRNPGHFQQPASGRRLALRFGA